MPPDDQAVAKRSPGEGPANLVEGTKHPFREQGMKARPASEL